ncbi:MAG TPA: murein L,D-transpeptidase catalytic domain family protein [Longimicrobiaceae bacterium]|nr:murein L,D-transpeptidase catalytic domain family protein [Longimicrobiaceae bacterium]
MRSHLLMLTTAAVYVGVGGSLLREPTLPPVATRVETGRDTASAPAPAPAPARTALAVSRTVLAGVGIEGSARRARVQNALEVLGEQIREQSDPDALRMAFQAYYNFAASHPERVRNPYLYFVDYGLDSKTPRGYVFDMQALRVVDGPFTVAHGRGSEAAGEGLPTRFSNQEGSAATSLGLFLTQETYPFVGHAGGGTYHSVGLRLTGLSGRFNSAALRRRVVAHGAPYVTPDRAGRSEGCPAMEPARARILLPLISNGGLVFLFSPLDRNWKARDPWASEPDLTPAANG